MKDEGFTTKGTLHPACKRLFYKAYTELEESIKKFKRVQNVKALQESLYLMTRLCYSWESVIGDERDGRKKLKSTLKQAMKGYREVCKYVVFSSAWSVSYDAFFGIMNEEEIKYLMER